MNRFDQFWKQHISSKGQSFYSKNFMSLISIMFADEPSNRMTLAELLSHPWLNEDVATEEEVIEEMNNRRATIGGTTPDADVPSSDPNIFEKVMQAHRGEGDVTLENINVSELKAKPYKEGISKGNCFYSTSDP